MSVWQRPIRLLLALFVVGVGVSVALGLRGRTESSPAAVVAERTDPDAVIETRGSRIVQADELGENLRVVADRQDTYRDGALRLIDNVEVTVADRDDRSGFVLTGGEARVDSDKTAVVLTGNVRMESADGLLATTNEATYSDVEGIVRMPTHTTLRRDGLEASGDQARYDRAVDVVRLLASAQVDLLSEGTRFQIVSRRATLAHADGYMQFENDVEIDTGSETMTAGQARAELIGATTQLRSLELRRHAAVMGSRAEEGALREMSADTIRLAYAEDGETLETATLTGAGMLTTTGSGGAAGARIRGRTMEISFDAAEGALRDLVAEDRVSLVLPETAEAPRRRITAERLSATSTTGTQLEDAVFEGDVVFEEPSTRGGGKAARRILRARRLEATLANGLTELSSTRFVDDVRLEDETMVAEADEALYAVSEGRLDLVSGDADGRVPRFEDERGSVQARTISVDVDGSRMTAEGDVESVLAADPTDVATEHRSGRSSLLDANDPVYVTAGQFTYDSELETAVYSDGARLWQSNAEFKGDRIVLDEARGDIGATGDVRTRTQITQVNDETGLPEESTTIGQAQEFFFEDDAHRATYTTDAQVTGPRSDLTADVVDLVFLPDGRTLDRLEAAGNVRLRMTSRWVSGESLVYYDSDGRYEMTGEPVEIVEEIDGECRETTGRRLTFFLIDDAVSVDGESEVRTATARGDCSVLTR